MCVSVCLSVCLYHHSGQTYEWISLKFGMMIGFDPNLKHELKFLESGYHGNEKKPKMVFLSENPLELQI